MPFGINVVNMYLPYVNYAFPWLFYQQYNLNCLDNAHFFSLFLCIPLPLVLFLSFFLILSFCLSFFLSISCFGFFFTFLSFYPFFNYFLSFFCMFLFYLFLSLFLTWLNSPLNQLPFFFFFDTHLSYSLNFIVVCHCLIMGCISLPSSGIVGKNHCRE